MEARNFLTTNFSPSMIEKSKGLTLQISEKSLRVEDLKGLEFISALTNIQLSNYLMEKGIHSATLGPEVKISLQKGDNVYVVNPGVKLHTLEGETLPPYASVSVTKIMVREVPQLKEELED